MPKIGNKRRKTRTHIDESNELPSSVPRSLILRRGKVGNYLQKLIKEMRILLYPYCAINLKESRKNSLKDFLSIVDLYNLSHMFAVTNTEHNSYLRIAKMPSGPTITFKIEKYCLSADIFNNAEVKKPLTKSFNHVPLIILNGFNSPLIKKENEEFFKLSGTMFQSIFPPLNLNEIEVKKAKRVVLINLNLNFEIPIFEIRHYDIDIEKSGGKKTISNIINNKKTNFSDFENISEYILKHTGYTDNEDSDNEHDFKLLLNENSKKTSEHINKVILNEIGPRINLSLHKIEEGFFKGNIIFHNVIKKSKKEIFETSKQLKVQRAEKRKRKEIQEQNVKKKEEVRLSKLTEEEKEFENEQKRKKERLLNMKRESDLKLQKDAEKQKVVSNRELKYLKNLKRGK